MVAFLFGSLWVFHRKFDRWVTPETRFVPHPMPPFDAMVLPIFRQMNPDEEELESARKCLGRACCCHS
jgi:uncharacterized iron-regulated membrane protein